MALPAVSQTGGAQFLILLFFSASLCPGDFVGMITSSHKLFRLDSRRSSSVIFAGAGHCCGRGDVAAAAETTCVKCGIGTTSLWLNCKDKPGTKICVSCYQKNSYEKKKAASANEA